MARHVAQIDPLRDRMPIVDQAGAPTPLFMRAFNSLFRNASSQGAVTVTAGAGLSGGGSLSDDITLSIDFVAEALRILAVIAAAGVAGTIFDGGAAVGGRGFVLDGGTSAARSDLDFWIDGGTA